MATSLEETVKSFKLPGDAYRGGRIVERSGKV